jgi:5-methylcytosine-specific restriction endonuclease McrA
MNPHQRRREWPKTSEVKAPKHSRTGPSAAVRRRVWTRSARCCERCGIGCTTFFRTVGEIHHRRNRSQGIDNSLSNLVLLCHLCHVWVGSDPNAAHAQGFHLEHNEVPTHTPLLYGGSEVEHYGRRWVLLGDDGTRRESPTPKEDNAIDRRTD